METELWWHFCKYTHIKGSTVRALLRSSLNFWQTELFFFLKYFGIGPTATFELLSFKNRSHIFKFLKLKNISELGVKPIFGDIWGLLSDRKLVIKWWVMNDYFFPPKQPLSGWIIVNWLLVVAKLHNTKQCNLTFCRLLIC